MSIYEQVDALLTTFKKPFYYGMPELPKEQPIFLTYDDYEVPLLAADDTLISTKINITIQIISKNLEIDLNKQIKKVFMANEFEYVGGGLLSGNDDTYPFKKRYHLEFQIDKEE